MSFLLEIPIGIPWSINLRAKDQSGNPLDLTGRTFTGQFFLDGNPILAPSHSFTDAVNGRIAIHLTQNDTGFGAPINLTYSFKISDPGGDIELLAGAAHFLGNVARDSEPTLNITRGSTWYSYYDVANGSALFDLTGYTVGARIKTSRNAVSGFKSPQCGLRPEIGVVTLTLSILETEALAEGQYFYEAWLDNGIDAFVLVQGLLNVISN
jgi:hypothetical protein